MWAELEMWRVQDGQFPELAVGDIWSTRLEVVLDHPEEIASSTDVGIRLIRDPLTPPGPRYEIVARVGGDADHGTFLDAGEIVITPNANIDWPEGTMLRFDSGLHGSESLCNDPPDPTVRRWQVLRLFVTYTRLVPDDEPNSWRSDSSDVRFEEVDRMHVWTREGTPFFLTQERRLAGYLLEIVPAS